MAGLWLGRLAGWSLVPAAQPAEAASIPSAEAPFRVKSPARFRPTG